MAKTEKSLPAFYASTCFNNFFAIHVVQLGNQDYMHLRGDAHCWKHFLPYKNPEVKSKSIQALN